MRKGRSLGLGTALLFAGLVLCAGDASAKTYAFTGWITSNRGKFINLPLIGNTPCISSTASGTMTAVVYEGPGASMVPTPSTPVTRTPRAANNASGVGCARAEGVLSTTGAGTGGAFTFPVDAFSRPAPVGGARVRNAPITAQVVQLATDFAIQGPSASHSPYPSMQGPTLGTPANVATHRVFRAGAHTQQSGRAGSMFTWCPGATDCTKVTEAANGSELIVKYSGGGSAFGGTMGFVVDAGAGDASIAVLVGLPPANIAFEPIVVSGEQVSGAGYAFRRTEMIPAGSAWSMYQGTVATTPSGYMAGVITMVSGINVPNFVPAHTSVAYGFPWTTMTVLARNTGTVLANPMVTTLSARGNDSVTSMGKRNLSLVAGSLAHNEGLLASNTPGIAQMYLPEPSGGASLVAGAFGLLAVASWRKRRRTRFEAV
jgi:hypothetical protein